MALCRKADSPATARWSLVPAVWIWPWPCQFCEAASVQRRSDVHCVRCPWQPLPMFLVPRKSLFRSSGQFLRRHCVRMRRRRKMLCRVRVWRRPPSTCRRYALRLVAPMRPPASSPTCRSSMSWSSPFLWSRTSSRERSSSHSQSERSSRISLQGGPVARSGHSDGRLPVAPRVRALFSTSCFG